MYIDIESVVSHGEYGIAIVLCNILTCGGKCNSGPRVVVVRYRLKVSYLVDEPKVLIHGNKVGGGTWIDVPGFVPDMIWIGIDDVIHDQTMTIGTLFNFIV
jgi:hypothetical protein